MRKTLWDTVAFVGLAVGCDKDTVAPPVVEPTVPVATFRVSKSAVPLYAISLLQETGLVYLEGHVSEAEQKKRMDGEAFRPRVDGLGMRPRNQEEISEDHHIALHKSFLWTADKSKADTMDKWEAARQMETMRLVGYVKLDLIQTQ